MHHEHLSKNGISITVLQAACKDTRYVYFDVTSNGLKAKGVEVGGVNRSAGAFETTDSFGFAKVMLDGDDKLLEIIIEETRFDLRPALASDFFAPRISQGIVVKVFIE